MKNLIISILLLFSLSAFSQEQELDYLAASPIYSIDLDKTPQTRQKVYASNFSNGLQLVADKINNKLFEQKITKYLKELDKTLMNNAGVILQVRLYTDEFGNTIMPQNFILPLSVGITPIDAYSDFLNTPSISSAPLNTTARDGSYFIWLYKTNDKIAIGLIPREFNKEFIKKSSLVAMEKTKLNSFSYIPLKSSIPNYIAQANFWNEKLKANTEIFEQQNNFDKVKELTEKFNMLQKEHNMLIQKYESLKNKEKNNGTLLKTMEIGLNLGSLFANEFNNDTPITYDPNIIKNQSFIIKKETIIIKESIDKTSSQLNDLNQKIKPYYELM